jgi:hypothetical protein
MNQTTASAATFPAHQPLSSSGSIKWTGVLLPLGFALANFWMLTHGEIRGVIAVIVAALLIAVTALSKPAGICATFLFLFLLGDFRRIVSVALGFPRMDPLLLVAPAVAIWLFLPLIPRLRFPDALTRAVFALMIVMLFEVLNPKQGGLSVGITGGLFYIIPICWFWIGRRYGSPELVATLLYRVVLPLGFVAAVLGIFQTYFGFLPWEQAWIDSGALNLHVGNAVRAFGFSVSPPEYARLLTFAAALLLARFFAGKRLAIVAFPLLLTAIVLESGRSVILKLIIALAVLWVLRSAHKRSFVRRFAVVFAVILALVYVGASRFASQKSSSGGSGTEALIAHQAGGFAHPLDAKKSTAGLHAAYIGKGFLAGLKSPLGAGLGATTLGASKLGGSQTADEDNFQTATELDFSDMFVALGITGGLLYMAIAFWIGRSTLRYVRTVPRYIALGVAGALAGTFGGWLISGEYSTSALVWFLIGALLFGRTNSPSVHGLPAERQAL